MCIEPILGVITTCLPVLKPIFNKIRNLMKKCSTSQGASISWKSRSIPIFMRASRVWKTTSENRSGRGGLDSMVSMEDSRRSESGGQSASKAEKVLGMKMCAIIVRRDVQIESACIEV